MVKYYNKLIHVKGISLCTVIIWCLYNIIKISIIFIRMKIFQRLSIKEGRQFVLFCSYEIHQTGMLDHVLDVVGKLLTRKKRCMGLVPSHLDLPCKSSRMLNDFFTENQIKLQLKFLEELECTFGVVGKILMNKILWNLFGKIQIQNVRDIDLKMISAAENSSKFQKHRFWKEKLVEDVLTFGANGTCHTSFCDFLLSYYIIL